MQSLRPYQIEAVNAVHSAFAKYNSILVVMATGCHAKGQKILKYSGELVNVEDIVVGDKLMGMDSTPRRVLSLARGRQEMVTIRPVKGEPWSVNLDHVLTLTRTQKSHAPSPSCRGGGVYDVTVREWLGWSNTKKHIHKLFRVPVDFPVLDTVPIVSPYILWALLGDGSLQSSVILTGKDPEIWEPFKVDALQRGLKYTERDYGYRCPSISVTRFNRVGENTLLSNIKDLKLNVGSERKFIPLEYKTGTFETRRQILAGLIDTDGYYFEGCFDYLSKSEQLANDVVFVARSLGLAAYKKKKPQKYNGLDMIYWRVCISGDCSIVPCRVPRKQAPQRNQIKDHRRTGFSVELKPVDDYYGFSLDGDGRYLLDDFTVTHNTGKTTIFSEVIKQKQVQTLVLAHRKELIDQAYNRITQHTGIETSVIMGSRNNHAPVIVGSVQSVVNHLDEIPVPGLIIVDEAHHAVSNTYQTVLERFPMAKILGLTATPDRTDGRALEEVFDHVAFRYETPQAIADGWLAPIFTKKAHGVSGLIAEVGSRKTIVFTPSVREAMEVAGLLPSATYVHGGLPSNTRTERIEAFNRGDFQYIVNCSLLTEGIDIPTITCVAMMRATESRALFVQALGRGLRLAPGKSDCLFLDLVDMPKHSLEGPRNALAGKGKVKPPAFLPRNSFWRKLFA